MLLEWIIILIAIVLIIVPFVFLTTTANYIDNSDLDDNIKMIGGISIGIINSLLILTFNAIYEMITSRAVEFENHPY